MTRMRGATRGEASRSMAGWLRSSSDGDRRRPMPTFLALSSLDLSECPQDPCRRTHERPGGGRLILSFSLRYGMMAQLAIKPVRRRRVSELHRVTVDPGQCGGRPCLRGLRIRVRDVLDLLAAGADRAEILADHPLLEDGDITAALEYAARQSDHPVLRVA